MDHMGVPYIPPEILAYLLPVGWFSAAYVLGSFPTSWLLARWITGQDLRRMGSGNVGVMNTALSVSRFAGLLVFLVEILKGFLAVIIPRALDAGDPITSLAVVGVVAGARWPVWLRFKGGRGNTTGMAAFLLISYPAPVIAMAFWILARMLLDSSFKATRLTILSLPFIIAMVTRSWWFVLAGLTLSLIYLSAQQPQTDDHLLIKNRWGSFWDFLSSPSRKS
jgi:acyl phosphate:glycerol-3-phosphate acyltransferase